MLPDETKAKEMIRRQFKDIFELSQGMLKLAVEILGADQLGGGTVHWRPRKGVYKATAYLALGLFVKTCHQLRAAIALAELGLVDDLVTISRSLFEAVLALNYLLRRRVALKENGKPLHPDPRKPLTTVMRTRLYVAHQAFEGERRLDLFQQTERLKRIRKALGDEAAIRRACHDAEKRIGQAWAKRLRAKGNYCGVSIKALAESFGIVHWYNSVYRIQSSTAHAADGLTFLGAGDGTADFSLRLGPNVDDVGRQLHLAAVLFLGALTIVNEHLGLGYDTQVDAAAERARHWGQQIAQSDNGTVDEDLSCAEQAADPLAASTTQHDGR